MSLKCVVTTAHFIFVNANWHDAAPRIQSAVLHTGTKKIYDLA